MFECICGYKGNSAHSKSCSDYHNEVSRVSFNINQYIVNLYLSNYSITECCEYVKDKEKTILSTSKIRKIIDPVLIDNGVKQNLDGIELNKKRQQKLKQTMLKKYGVINNGQRENQGWARSNQIKYKKLDFDVELTNFKKKVDYLTRKYVEKLKKEDKIPSTCYYTKKLFSDVNQKAVNPNDPYKRSVDHKIPVVEMFLKGLTPEETCNETNIVFCLKAVNTYKANTPREYFEEKILPYLMERL